MCWFIQLYLSYIFDWICAAEFAWSEKGKNRGWTGKACQWVAAGGCKKTKERWEEGKFLSYCSLSCSDSKVFGFFLFIILYENCLFVLLFNCSLKTPFEKKIYHLRAFFFLKFSIWTVKPLNLGEQVLSESLKADIPAMINSLLNMGLDVKVNIEELARQEAWSYCQPRTIVSWWWASG